MQTWQDWSESYVMEKATKKKLKHIHPHIYSKCMYISKDLPLPSQPHTQTCAHVHLLNEAKEMFHFFFSHLKFISCNWPKFMRKSFTQNSKESWSLDSWSFITDDIQENAFDILKWDKRHRVDLLFLDISCSNWFFYFLSVSFSLHHSFSLSFSLFVIFPLSYFCYFHLFSSLSFSLSLLFPPFSFKSSVPFMRFVWKI